MSDSRIPDQPPRKRDGSSWRGPQRLLLIAGIVLFIAGIVATMGVPAFDIALTDSPDDDSAGEPPGIDEPDEGDDAGADNDDEEPTEADDEADPAEDPPPDDGADSDEETDEQEAMDADDETDTTDEEDDEADEDAYTYSATVEVEDADSGDPVEGVTVELYPVDEEPEQYTTDEDGEVTIAFEHDAPDDTFEYVLAVGDGERIVEIEQGEQTEPVPLSSDPEEP